MLIQCTTGFENFPQSSAKTHVFVVPTARMLGKEMHISMASKGVYPGLRKVGVETRQPAAPNLRRELGEWVTASYDVPDGMLLKIFASRSGGWGQMRGMANQFIRVRSDAALRRVSAVLTGNERASIVRASIEGRFDLVTLGEALLLGVAVPPSFRSSFDETMQRRAFEYHEVEPELRAVATTQTRVVTNADGEEREVSTAVRRRALDL